MDTPKTPVPADGDAPEIDSPVKDSLSKTAIEFSVSGKAPVSQSGQPTDERDAAKRGGPKTQNGKEKSKHNALKHGIFSQVLLLKGEPRVDYDSLLAGLHSDFKPKGKFEELLVDKLAATTWRHRRLMIAERDRFAMVEIIPYEGLESLMRYEANLERAFDRILNQLERLQRIRQGQPVPPPMNLHVLE